MNDDELVNQVATLLCQYGRITRDMPGTQELKRALPRAQQLIDLVRKNSAAEQARRLGHGAYHEDKSELACPFAHGTPDRAGWLIGFAEAREESRHETNGTSPAEGE